jgi:hypothetical protein
LRGGGGLPRRGLIKGSRGRYNTYFLPVSTTQSNLNNALKKAIQLFVVVCVGNMAWSWTRISDMGILQLQPQLRADG